MLKNKIDSVFSLKGKNINDFCKRYNISQPNISQKGKKNSYYLKEGVLFADFINTDLCFVDRETGEVLGKLTLEDIQ